VTRPEQYRTSTDPATGGAEDADAAGVPTSPVGLEQPFTAADLYSLRAAVSAHADAAGLPQPVIDALLIITGELSSNVVLHGGGTGCLTLWRAGDDVILQVSDHGPGIKDPDGAGRAAVPTSAPAGRGLWIVRQLSRHVDIVAAAHGTTVTATVAVVEPGATGRT
jgi:anti-sigma regulatory factor (Ser/Thr protein kinase)